MDYIPIAIFWAIAFWGLSFKPHILVYIFFGSVPFGSFAAIPTALTAGLTLTPAPIAAALIIIRSMVGTNGLKFYISTALTSKRLLLLFCFWVVCVVVTYFSPRLFANLVSVYPVKAEGAASLTNLEPTTQNFSQLAYISISIFAVFAFFKLFRDPIQRQHALRAMCFGASMLLLTGFLDFLSQYVPIDVILEPFRTATYSLLNETAIADVKRVVGLMPEASIYGYLCITFLSFIYFLRPLIQDEKLRDTICPVLIVALIGFVFISTSSGAYVSFVIFAMSVMLQWVRERVLPTTDPFMKRGLGIVFWVGFSGVLAFCLVLLFNPSMFNPILNILDELIFNKTQSESYEERSRLTASGWSIVGQTWGIGVGLGGARTSSFVAAVISNTGILGGLLYFGFLYMLFFLKPSRSYKKASMSYLANFQYAFLPGLVCSILVIPNADFGLQNAFLYGLLLSIKLDKSFHIRNI